MVIGIYCRFSKQIDDIQSQSSLKHQLSNGKKFCEEMGYDYRVYSETVSGGIEMSDRNEGKKLIDDIENGIIDGVWVDKEDRLYRNFDESIIFKIILKKNQIKYFIGNSEIDFENDNDKIVNTVLSLLSDIEKKNINRRMSRGLKDRLLRGEHIGRIGYGFTKCKETNKILIDEEIKEKINKCYKSFIDKEWDNLRDWMFYCRKKIGVVKSTMWFYDLYRKTNYNGLQYIKYGGTEYKIKLPKMVSDNLYNQFCDKMRTQLSKGVSNNQKKDFTNIVRGKVYCGSCYHKLHILPNPTKNYRTLRCSFSGRRFTELYVGEKRNIPKHKTSFKYKFISNVIYNQLVEILLNSYTIKEEFKNRYMSQFDITEKRNEIKKWEKELNKLNDREVRLENSLIDGLISKENILKHKEKIQLERIRIEGFIMSIEDDINTHKESKKIMKW
ncbi:MAG: recombinase family protein, partial [Oceanospirillaceae bacterium]|nr:recombinase family protein [Oceanospirillaceae bacterium]